MYEVTEFVNFVLPRVDSFLAKEAEMLIRRGNPNDQGVDKAAQKLHERYTKGVPKRELVLRMMSVSAAVDDLKVKRFGLEYSTTVSNAIIHCFLMKSIRNFEVSQSDVYEIRELAERLAMAGGRTAWFVPKLISLFTELQMKLNLAKWIRDFSLPNSERMMSNLEKNLSAVENEMAVIMSGIAVLRKYGVKTCFFEDGITHGASEAWFFIDPAGLSSRETNQQNIMRNAREHLALIALGDKPKKGQRVSFDYDPIQGDNWHVRRFSLNIDGKFCLTLDAKGELHLLNSYACAPVRGEFAKIGKSSEYELLRMAHALRLYDLVVPLTMVSKVSALPTGQSRIGRFLGRGREELITPELILPRVRLLDSFGDVLRELDQEIEEAEIETARRCKSKHEVISFVRRLPAGHHPSAQAKKKAWEAGITLAENETFVMKHSRGSGAMVGTPKAVQRKR